MSVGVLAQVSDSAIAWTDVVSALWPPLFALSTAAVAAFWFFIRRTSSAKAEVEVEVDFHQPTPGAPTAVAITVSFSNVGNEPIELVNRGVNKTLVVYGSLSAGQVANLHAAKLSHLPWAQVNRRSQKLFERALSDHASVNPGETARCSVGVIADPGTSALWAAAYVSGDRRGETRTWVCDRLVVVSRQES